jgi:hypothetical protein
MARTVRSLRHAMQIGTVGFALSFFVSPAQAVTCDEVRGLTATELSYWAKRLKVTPAYLVTLLEKSFCESRSEPPAVVVSNHKKL